MRIAIVGSRDFHELDTVTDLMKAVVEKYSLDDYMIVSGGARGADSLAQQYAKISGKSILIHYPDYNTYGKSAAFRRNVTIINDSDLVIAFWDGQSRGTEHSINIALEQEKKVIIYNYISKEITKNYEGGITDE